jgi:hypothetical protein
MKSKKEHAFIWRKNVCRREGRAATEEKNHQPFSLNYRWINGWRN